MTAAAVDKRLLAVERLLAGGKVAGVVGVVDLVLDIDFDSAERIDHCGKTVEVDFRIMADGNAGKAFHRFNGARRAAERIGGVDLLRAMRADSDLRVARDGDKGYFLVFRVDARKDHGVGAVSTAVFVGGFALFALVDADKQHVERVGRGIGYGKRVQQVFVHAVVQGVVDVAHVRPCRTGAGKQQDEQHGKRGDKDTLALALLAGALVGQKLAVVRAGNAAAVRDVGSRTRRAC